MNVQHSDPVLRRKVAPKPAAETEQERGQTSGPAQLIARGFARAVSGAGPMIAENGRVARGRASLDEMLDQIAPESFVALVGDDDALPGIAVITQLGFASVIEAMTIGRFSQTAPTPRRATGTDSSLLADLLGQTFADLPASDPAASLRFRRPVPDHRLLPVLLEDVAYDLVTLDIDLIAGDHTRELTLTLCLPQSGGANVDDGDPVTGGDAATQWSAALQASVMNAPANLRAELGRVKLPLAEVLELGEGSTLVLPLTNLEEVRLVALDGVEMGQGRLGQARGMRAVRLVATPGQSIEPKMMSEAMPSNPGAVTSSAARAEGHSRGAEQVTQLPTPAATAIVE